jgi:hypothetical protein
VVNRAGNAGVPPAWAPYRVRVPVHVQQWTHIAFLHWAIAPHDITPLLPHGLTPLTYDGMAWVGVIPFIIRVRPPGIPIVPPGWAFPETNVRTYVCGPDGRQGVWFLHMEVTATWFAVALRQVGLPYVRQPMAVEIGDERIVYTSKPRRSRMVVRPRGKLQQGGGPFERFLTARWGAFHRRGPLVAFTPVEHEPWAVRTAEVETCEVDPLFHAAGLQPPTGPPVAHMSPGVTSRIGVPRRVA